MRFRHPRRWLLAAATAALLALTTGGAILSGSAVAATGKAAAAAATGGCGRNPTLANGTHSISSGGTNRSYILKVPGNYDRNHPYRLIFAFHWVGGTANDVASGGTDRDVWSYYGLMQLSNNSAILVAPQGINNGWGNSGGQDVTFVDDMIRQIEGDLCVDNTQLFSVGFSYGGAMTYALACARATVFRAVAVYSGGQLSGCSGGNQPIAYLGIHGISDGTLGIAGGRAMRDTFVRNNGCTSQNPPEPRQGSLTHITTSYSGCRAGYPVQWAAFDGGHTPGPVDGGGDSGARTWTKGVVWAFFSQFQTGPSPSPTTPSPSPTTPSPGTAACQVGSTVNAWNTGLTENLTITNTGPTAITNWSLVFSLPGGQSITSGWNANYAPASGQVTAKNMPYNAVIAAGASVSIGFQATHTGNTAKPSAFSLNGTACTSA